MTFFFAACQQACMHCWHELSWEPRIKEPSSSVLLCLKITRTSKLSVKLAVSFCGCFGQDTDGAGTSVFLLGGVGTASATRGLRTTDRYALRQRSRGQFVSHSNLASYRTSWRSNETFNCFIVSHLPAILMAWNIKKFQNFNLKRWQFILPLTHSTRS